MRITEVKNGGTEDVKVSIEFDKEEIDLLDNVFEENAKQNQYVEAWEAWYVVRLAFLMAHNYSDKIKDSISYISNEVKKMKEGC